MAKGKGRGSRLTAEEKEEILEEALAGEKTVDVIAKEHGISMATVYVIKKQHAEESKDEELPEGQRKWMCSRCGNNFTAEPEEGEDKPTCKCGAAGSYISEIQF